MAWSVNNIYESVLFLLRKNQAGSVTAKDLFYAWNIEQNAYHSDLTGKWQAKSNGKSGANTGLILNEVILTQLSPFTMPASLTIVSGIAQKPDDFIYELALRFNGEKVTKITHGQKSYVTKDVIDPPSVTDSKFYVTEYENYYSVLPEETTGSLQLDYIASCNDIIWGFTYDADGRHIYDPTTSVQPKWSNPTIIEITKRTLTSFGVSFKDADFERFGQRNTVTGDS